MSKIQILIVYWMVAFLFSCFYGRKAIKIFTHHKLKDLRPCGRAQLIWLNFVCSMVGWGASFQLLIIKSEYLSKRLEIGLNDVPLLLIALVGVTGLLPYTITRITSILPIK